LAQRYGKYKIYSQSGQTHLPVGPEDGRIRPKHVAISHDIHVRHLVKEFKY